MRTLISARDKYIRAKKSHKTRTRLSPKSNARTGSLLAYRVIRSHHSERDIGERDIREWDIGKRNIGERDIRERDSQERDIPERDMGETVATCRFAE
jgi:hypothetical protein